MMYGKNKDPLIIITDDVLKDIVQVYGKLDPDVKSLESGIPEFKIKRAIKSLLVVMERYNIDLGVSFDKPRDENESPRPRARSNRNSGFLHNRTRKKRV